MRKILKAEEKEKLLENYRRWFDVKYEDDKSIVFIDLIGNRITYIKYARTRLFFFQLVDESLMKYKNKSFTFVSAPKKFKEYNIQKKEAENVCS